MSDLALSQVCIVMRNGLEIWVDKERGKRIQSVLQALSVNKFIDFEDRSINTADIMGVFLPTDMEALTRRKNGQWQCSTRGTWHDKGEKCDCVSELDEYHTINNLKFKGVKLSPEHEERYKYLSHIYGPIVQN